MDQSVIGVGTRPDFVERRPVLLPVVHQGTSNDMRDALPPHFRDVQAVVPKLVVDADRVLSRPIHLGHACSVVGDWALDGPARCWSHWIRVASHVH